MFRNNLIFQIEIQGLFPHSSGELNQPEILMKLKFLIFILILFSATAKSAIREAIILTEKAFARTARVAARGMATKVHHSSESWGTISCVTEAIEAEREVVYGTRPLFNAHEMKEKGYYLSLPQYFGIWYRGVNNKKFKLTPGIQRLVDPRLSTDNQTMFLEETGMFTEYQLKSPNVHHAFNNPDLHRSIDNIMSWLTFMQHYGLPTRLLDWTSNIKTALFFAASGGLEGKTGKLHVLNAVRLNNYVLDDKGFGVCPQDDLSVSLRAELSLAHNAEDLLNRKTIFEHESYITHVKKRGDPADFLAGLEMPIAVEARRYNPRIVSQEGYFTIHGGKIFPPSMKTTLPRPKTLEELNEEAISSGHSPFLISFDIDNQERILRELEVSGITEDSLLGSKDDETTKEMETLALALKEYWTLERSF